MQGDAKWLKTVATCKHFAAYNIENYNDATLGATAMRQKFNALVTPQDLADTFLPPFRACVSSKGQGGAAAAAVMCR